MDLNQSLIKQYYKTFSIKTWKKLRILSADTTTLRLPPEKEIIEAFGNPNQSRLPLVQVSQLYDCLNKLSLDAAIDRYNTGDRLMLLSHLDHLSDNDVLVLDRGYPAHWLFCLLQSKSIRFCVRLQTNSFKELSAFIKSKATTHTLTLYPTSDTRVACKKHGITAQPTQLRFVKVDLEGKDPEYLATNLVDEDDFTIQDFKELYHYRWTIEEDFKVIKTRIRIENFSGKTLHSILQDFYAGFFTKNLAAVLTKPADESIPDICRTRKFPYQKNTTYVLSLVKKIWNRLFKSIKIPPLIERLNQLCLENLSPIRLNRSYPRKVSKLNRNFYQTYKPI